MCARWWRADVHISFFGFGARIPFRIWRGSCSPPPLRLHPRGIDRNHALRANSAIGVGRAWIGAYVGVEKRVVADEPFVKIRWRARNPSPYR